MQLRFGQAHDVGDAGPDKSNQYVLRDLRVNRNTVMVASELMNSYNQHLLSGRSSPAARESNNHGAFLTKDDRYLGREHQPNLHAPPGCLFALDGQSNTQPEGRQHVLCARDRERRKYNRKRIYMQATNSSTPSTATAAHNCCRYCTRHSVRLTTSQAYNSTERRLVIGIDVSHMIWKRSGITHPGAE